MFKVIDKLVVGDTYCVSVEGDISILKNGMNLVDDKGNIFEIETVGMSNYKNVEDYRTHVELVLKGEVENIGNVLRVYHDALNSTYSMLFQAFPNGICEEYYMAVLRLLYDDMADENLALVMSDFTDKPMGIVTNDIYKVCQMEWDSKLLEEVKGKLDTYGFEEWKKA